VLLFCRAIAEPVFSTSLCCLFSCMVSFIWIVPNPFCYVNLDFKFFFMDSQSRGLKLKVSRGPHEIENKFSRAGLKMKNMGMRQ